MPEPPMPPHQAMPPHQGPPPHRGLHGPHPAWLLAALLLLGAAALWALGQRGDAPGELATGDGPELPTGAVVVEEMSAYLLPASGSGRNSYRLAFRLAEAGYPVIFHVDERAEPQLLWPPADWIAYQGGRDFQLPQAGSGMAWRLEGEGAETLIMAANADPRPSLLALEEAARSLPANRGNPEALQRQLAALLYGEIGPVKRLDFRQPDERPAGGGEERQMGLSWGAASPGGGAP